MGSQRPFSRQPFVHNLLPPDDPWPQAFQHWQVLLSATTPTLPTAYAKFGSLSIPMASTPPDGWSPRRLEFAGSDEEDEDHDGGANDDDEDDLELEAYRMALQQARQASHSQINTL